MPLRALYVDFNSYFASVEQQLRPRLRGRPLGVLPVLAETTCCIAASYEAKAFGVGTGTLVHEARRRCPDMVFVEARPALYVEMHHRLVAAVESCTPVGRVLSIDEMVCPLTGSERQRDQALTLAARIKHTIAASVGEYLKSSIGIAPNAFLAKIASNMQKPDGCTVIEDAELPDILYRLELTDIPGIGRATAARLRRSGIHTMQDMTAANAAMLRAAWGSIEGERMHARLRGEEVAAAQGARNSVGHSHVLPPELRNWPAAHSVLHRLLQKAAMRLRSHALIAGALALRVKCGNGEVWRDELRFARSADTLTLLHAFAHMWQRRGRLRAAPLAVAVTLTDLDAATHQSRSLFDDGHDQAAHDRLNAVIDAVNLRYGRNTLYFGGAHNALKAAPLRIAFQHIPDLEVEAD